MTRIFIARLMAAVILLTSALQVVLVECRTATHHAVELVGHADEATTCAAADDHGPVGCGHDEHHPDGCDDSALFDPVPPQRSDLERQAPGAAAPLLAIPAPIQVWTPAVATDPSLGPQCCPRPPPDLPQASDGFVIIRLQV